MTACWAWAAAPPPTSSSRSSPGSSAASRARWRARRPRGSGCGTSHSAFWAPAIRVRDRTAVNNLPVYVDGADEVTRHLAMIKGGGGALTREKIVAAVADKFICIADASKRVDILGKFPLPVEVIPMARSYVARELVKLGGHPEWRPDFVPDHGKFILGVHGRSIL